MFLQSAQEYRQRSLLEKELLYFAYDVFGIPFVDPVSQGAGAGVGGGWESMRGQGMGVSGALCNCGEKTWGR